jgi:hypothetical protein
MVLFTNSQFGSPNIRLYQCPSENVPDSPCHNLMENIQEDFKANITIGNVNAVYAKGDFGKGANESDPSWHETDPSQTQRMYWQLVIGTTCLLAQVMGSIKQLLQR